MNQEEQKKLLLSAKQEEKEILAELCGFTQEDPHAEGGFRVPFPNEGTSLDENAREIEEFERLNAMKNNLVKRLRDVRLTAKKILEGSYGQCEFCLSGIEAGRLKVAPAARFCIGCAKQNPREA